MLTEIAKRLEEEYNNSLNATRNEAEQARIEAERAIVEAEAATQAREEADRRRMEAETKIREAAEIETRTFAEQWAREIEEELNRTTNTWLAADKAEAEFKARFGAEEARAESGVEIVTLVRKEAERKSAEADARVREAEERRQ